MCKQRKHTLQLKHHCAHCGMNLNLASWSAGFTNPARLTRTTGKTMILTLPLLLANSATCVNAHMGLTEEIQRTLM